jgi:hypothetical protein
MAASVVEVVQECVPITKLSVEAVEVILVVAVELVE